MYLAVLCVTLSWLPVVNFELLAEEAAALRIFGEAIGLALESNPCDINGVTCSAGHVVELDFKRLTSRKAPLLNDAVCGLTQLEKLWLTRSKLVGSIPVCLGRTLKHLQELNLFNNALTGGLPEEICLLKNLSLLQFNKNGIGGTLPNCLSQLTKLTKVNFGGNQLVGTLPKNADRLQSLISFRAGLNGLFGGIPEGFGAIASLREFVLADNSNINGSIPDTFGQLGNRSSLELFNVANTDVSGAIPVSMTLLPSLQDLRIERTRLTKMPSIMNCETISVETHRLPFCFCPPGTYWMLGSSGGLNCIPCERSTYNEHLHTDSCTPCPAGTWTLDRSNNNSAACLCILGSEINRATGLCEPCREGYEGSAPQLCTHCVAGKYAPNIGSTRCLACSPGYYQTSLGAHKCEICQAGRFQPNAGSTACEACGDSFVTDVVGALNASACVCPQGKHFHTAIGACELCPAHVFCPGGHRQTSTNRDITPLVQEGFMSLITDPLSIYSCIGDARVCPGSRSPYIAEQGSMCPYGFVRLPQCAICEKGYFKSLGNCERCSQAWWELFVLRPVGAFVVELLLVAYMYWRWNRPNPSGLVTLGLGVKFYQYLLVVGSLPLEWPRFLDMFFSTLKVLNVSFAYPFVRPECIFDDKYTWRLFRLLLSPSLIVPLLTALYCFAACVGKRLKVDYLINIIGLVYNGLFIVITRFSLALFLVDPMPNGKNMIKEIPELEYGAKDWHLVWPLGVLAFCLYNMSFLAFVTRAVVVAPKLAASYPGFLDRYRFAFGPLRPDKWWWALVGLVFGCALNIVQVVSRNVQMQLYLSILLFIIICAAEFQLQPFKFRSNNFVDLSLKAALITFQVFATAFVDTEIISPLEAKANAKLYAIVMLATVIIPIIIILGHVLVWGVSKLEKETRSVGRAAKLVFGFRDVVAQQMLMSDREVLSHMTRMGDADLLSIATARDTILTAFLGMQPGPELRNQRLLPGNDFRIWDQAATAARVLQASQDGELHTSVQKNAQRRSSLIKLALELDASGYSLTSVSAEGLTPELFVEALSGRTSLEELELRNVYDMLDIDGDGQVSAKEFCLTVDSVLSENKMRQVSRRIAAIDGRRITENSDESDTGVADSQPLTASSSQSSVRRMKKPSSSSLILSDVALEHVEPCESQPLTACDSKSLQVERIGKSLTFEDHIVDDGVERSPLAKGETSKKLYPL